jgi:hypothetical protein
MVGQQFNIIKARSRYPDCCQLFLLLDLPLQTPQSSKTNLWFYEDDICRPDIL